MLCNTVMSRTCMYANKKTKITVYLNLIWTFVHTFSREKYSSVWKGRKVCQAANYHKKCP